MLVQHSNSHLQLHDASKLPVNEVNVTVWYYLDPYHLAGVSTDFFLDDDHIVYLTETCKVLKNLSANLEHVSFYARNIQKSCLLTMYMVHNTANLNDRPT